MSVTMDVNKTKRNRKGNANPKGNANHVAIGKLRDGKKWQQFRKGKGEKPENPLSKKKKAENKTAREDREIEQLEERCKRPIDAAKVEKFSDFPISSATIRGLADVKIKDKDKEKEKAKFVTPTEIQREAIGFALQGRDVLGAAKTGSGKTLAFLIPLLERLFRQKWSPQDGLGAIVISPTRELAHQTFGTLRKVGKFHDFSAGLVIGGHVDHAREGEMMATCNIVVCTPGRLLQHMDESPEFDATNLQVLVLDEADRCLETFFAEQMNAIVSNLPTTRQTMLFSATQTKSVRELARLSLEDPVLVSVHEHAERATPDELKEYYAVCELGQKLDMLHAFLKREIKKKIIVFVSSCKQVKFLLEVLKKLRLYTTVTGLYGTLKQHRRIDIYEDFCQKRSGVLIATDVASRGLGKVIKKQPPLLVLLG
jgi:ATP-dependent RNA helicase DDX10/DBP4